MDFFFFAVYNTKTKSKEGWYGERQKSEVRANVGG